MSFPAIHSIRDSNLYTLVLRPSTTSQLPSSSTSGGPIGLSPHPFLSTITDLVEPAYVDGTGNQKDQTRYYVVRDNAGSIGTYSIGIYDAYSDLLLSSLTCGSSGLSSASSLPRTEPFHVSEVSKVQESEPQKAKPWYKRKQRTLNLYNPSLELAFEMSGSLTFEWSFSFEDYRFRWRRETFSGSDYICSIERKPDPSVEVCVARHPSKGGKEGIIQLLDYNLERFRIQDLKGLEIALYTSIISILEAASDRPSSKDAYTSPYPSGRPNGHATSNGARALSSTSTNSQGPLITADDYEDDFNPNEVIVNASGSSEVFATRCVSLLQDDAILFIIIRSKDAAAVTKAVEVADATKRMRHRAGLDQEREHSLRQYVVENEGKGGGGLVSNVGPRNMTAKASKLSNGPKVIDLNDKPKSPKEEAAKRKTSVRASWTPPTGVSIFLSKIDLPDLHPGRNSHQTRRNSRPSSPLPPGSYPQTQTQTQSLAKHQHQLQPSRHSPTPTPSPRPSQPTKQSRPNHGASARPPSSSAIGIPGEWPGPTDSPAPTAGGSAASGSRWSKLLNPRWK